MSIVIASIGLGLGLGLGHSSENGLPQTYCTATLHLTRPSLRALWLICVLRTNSKFDDRSGAARAAFGCDNPTTITITNYNTYSAYCLVQYSKYSTGTAMIVADSTK